MKNMEIFPDIHVFTNIFKQIRQVKKGFLESPTPIVFYWLFFS